jgi:septal ring factor EnvC (AmiA/AmiB activator)
MRLSPENPPEQEEISDDVRKQKEMKAELTAQLERLKTDVAQLETWTRRTEQPLGDPEPETEAVRSLVLVF